MGKKQIVFIIILAVALLGGTAWLIAPAQDPATQLVGETNTTDNSTPTPTLKEQGVAETLNGCTRNYNESVLTSSTIDFRSKIAIVSVKGFGDLKIELYDSEAPQTVENFVRLAESGFYDCLLFHRLAKGFVLQGGDPEGVGTGGRTASGKPLPDELNPSTSSYRQGYVKGVVAMANKQLPNSGTSQFFIMLADSGLDHKYTIFGKVIEGLDILDNIATLEIEPKMGPTDGAPKTPVVMEKVSIVSK